jgi:hypothetical protein
MQIFQGKIFKTPLCGDFYLFPQYNYIDVHSRNATKNHENLQYLGDFSAIGIKCFAPGVCGT